ncbi:MAG TPA: hypothetical protein VIV11_41025 [Kofleriaceae bacterium]
MRAVLAIGLCSAVGCAPPGAPHAPADIIPYDPAYVASSQRLRATLARDNIELDTQPVLTTCDFPELERECARCEVATVVDQIDPELVDAMAIAFARYPSSVRKAARLERVAFCRTIHYVGKDHGPAGLADPNTHRIYIGVEYFRTAHHTFSIEHAVHHEVFHLLDFATNGPRAVADYEWAALNPKGFEYTESGGEKREPGFVNTYAQTDAVEDRASTFEYLMVRPDELCAMADDDAVLARKVRLLWQRVALVEGANRLGVTAPCVKAKPTKRKPVTKTKRKPITLPGLPNRTTKQRLQ